MIKFAITGSLSSGKSTASKIISSNVGPLFNADNVVKKLYKTNSFKKKISRVLKINSKINIKSEIKKQIQEKKITLKRIEQIIHPFVRKEMKNFIKKNKNKKFLFFEIPLLVESKLLSFFDVTIFIKSKKTERKRRFMLKNSSNNNLFNLLDGHQIKDTKKMKFCDHIIVNNKSLNFLKKKLLNIIYLYF